jgi:glycerol-3-phosphate dehydrogenase
MIGSTDIRIDNPDQAICTEEEIEYILGMVPRIFPSLNVTSDQIIFQFSGVRPLPAAKGSTGQISRDHSIEVQEKSSQSPWPILNLVGGKWTSYRAFSEQVTDEVIKRLKKSRQASTANIPIGGGKDFPTTGDQQENWTNNIVTRTGIPQKRIQQLFNRYGTRAEEIALHLAGGNDTSLTHNSEYSREEIAYLVENEMITHLDDFLIRRSKLAWTNQISLDLIVELAGIIGEKLEWTDEVQQGEIDRTLLILRDTHAVKI